MNDSATEPAGQDLTEDILSKALGDALRDQRLRQERLRHAQEFLSSPAFLELRDSTIVVSDDARTLAEHRRDLGYRITVLESVLALLTEERDLLDQVVPGGGDTPPADTVAKDA